MNRRKRLKQRQKRKKLFLKFTIATGIIIGFFFLIAISVLADAVKLVPQLENPKASQVDQTTKIYASDKRLIVNLHAEQHRIIVPLKKIPKNLQNAVIAIEDRRFRTHNGVDLEAIIRAFVENLRSGRIVEGGSTLTQQYVKNVFISREKTYTRKVKEAVLAYELEKRFTKDKILEKYLNTAYFGHGNYGVESAAEAYFGKKVDKLNLAESALLAGVIRSPQRYSPRNHKKKALARRNLVLSKMAEARNEDKNGNKKRFITEVESIKAKAVSLKIKPVKEGHYPAAYFVENIKRQILSDKKFGETEQDRAHALYKGGLRIYTTVNLKMQQMADNAIKNILDRKGDPSASLVSIQPKTGYVKAMSGGHDFFNLKDKNAKFNLATQAKRQTGSSFKVFVLVTALTQGMTPYKTFDSSPATLKIPGGGTWKVNNYSGKGYGRMTIREGTVKSVNALYGRLMLEVGAKNVVKIAHKMGIKSKLEANPAIALGGLKHGVNTYEMASAMATLANNGAYIKPITITKITDSNGKIILSNKPKPKQVISPNVTSTANAVLQDVIRRGTGRGANIGRPAAGKTGTAQSYRDAWFIGYTPDLSTAVWVGYPQAQIAMLSVHGRRVSGGSFPARIWARFMRAALINTPRTRFPFSRYYARERQIEICNGTTNMRACSACPKGSTYMKTFYERNPKLVPCNMHDCNKEDKVKIPNVVGLSSSQAAKKLNAAGFGIKKVSAESSKPAGTVVKQSPSGGKKTEQGKTVTIYISKGVTQSTVPAVVGMNEADASSALSSAGFSTSVTYQAGDAAQVGIVISQSPAGDSEANEGSSVTIVVGQ